MSLVDRVVGRSFIGGARMGWVNASWPFAKLTVRTDRVRLASLRTFDFAPQDVVGFERYGWVPVIATGVRIRHNRLDYPDRIVFWTLGRPQTVFEAIDEAGFVPSGRGIERSVR
ncbi:hypothetical protein BH10PSE17_BH10PSE17_18560 [soil metagenome]